MNKKTLIVEGASTKSNGTLRQGFHKLLIQVLEGKMPEIIMGDGKSQSIQKFKKNKLSDFTYLLVDLDGDDNIKDQDLVSNDLKSHEDVVFYMIQEMEAWFISQPEILDEFYKEKISPKFLNKNPKKIPNPSNALERATKNSQKGKYHKVNHGTALLNYWMQIFCEPHLKNSID